MSYSISEFENLTSKYGIYAGWAVWEYFRSRAKEASIECIYENISTLNCKNVILGLNVSEVIRGAWSNFRGGKHDRKLKYAFNNSLRGSYITDLYKGIENADSVEVEKYLSQNRNVVDKNIDFFKEEMKSLNLNSDSRFIVLGTENSILGRHFTNYFQHHFANNTVLFHRHYSSRGSDREWVEGIWTKLGIKDDFDKVLEQYK